MIYFLAIYSIAWQHVKDKAWDPSLKNATKHIFFVQKIVKAVKRGRIFVLYLKISIPLGNNGLQCGR